MKNAIIVHGRPGKEEYYSDEYPSSSNFHWIPWLQKQLIIQDIKADTPEMSHAYAPNWDTWKREFERFDITPETILVGHSNGAGFLVRWLSEHPDVRVGKVVLVAPSFYEGELARDFFDFEIDPDLASRTAGVTIFNGEKDDERVHKSVRRIMDSVPGVRLVSFPERGHFITDDMGVEFPELVDEILR